MWKIPFGWKVLLFYPRTLMDSKENSIETLLFNERNHSNPTLSLHPLLTPLSFPSLSLLHGFAIFSHHFILRCNVHARTCRAGATPHVNNTLSSADQPDNTKKKHKQASKQMDKRGVREKRRGKEERRNRLHAAVTGPLCPTLCV
jgi:hypothetical protein